MTSSSAWLFNGIGVLGRMEKRRRRRRSLPTASSSSQQIRGASSHLRTEVYLWIRSRQQHHGGLHVQSPR
ncbi:hypothetical protein ATANTOWER_011862 [Ataeniobius toweri]|uniref:Uncharacterized protein n=1 Tax=Ataeniobius toweri TaxID=208326 RepID=A0ABU7B122_9TELE|nr:hypothetical protein [Ataeniobius toweri]